MSFRSATMNSARPPSASIAATVCAPRSESRPVMSTVAPRRANSLAVSRPIPAVAPVTSTRWSWRSMTCPHARAYTSHRVGLLRWFCGPASVDARSRRHGNRGLSHRAGRVLKVVGSDHESGHGGRLIPNHAPTVACSVLHHNIAWRKQQLRAIVDLDYDIAGEKDPEIRRVGPVHAGFVAVLDVHLGSGFWCNDVKLWRVRRHREADATHGWEYARRRRIVPRVRVGCGLIGTPEEGELSQARDGNRVDLLVTHKNSATLRIVAGDNPAYLHSLPPSRLACSWSPSPGQDH